MEATVSSQMLDLLESTTLVGLIIGTAAAFLLLLLLLAACLYSRQEVLTWKGTAPPQGETESGGPSLGSPQAGAI